MFNPISTYRVQFHSKFTFEDLKAIVPYLKQLGVKTLYASPIFKAVEGSTHGYDCTDPHVINPEIGTEKQFIQLTQLLKESGISWLQDIVPNHMAYHLSNARIYDVLKNGKASTYALYFDINWIDGKLILPIMNETVEDAIKSGDLKLVKHKDEFCLQYQDTQLPLNKQPGHKEINAEGLVQLVREQHYELCEWQTTNERINFRRFFLINGLICLNMQDVLVFDDYHKKVRDFVEQKYIDGLRIDHIDGLHDPEEYLNRLRKYLPPDTYINVEKILQANEQLPTWTVQGTTGYDFLAMVNNLFTYKEHEDIFDEYYLPISSLQSTVHEDGLKKKSYILFRHMRGELQNLYRLFEKIIPEEDTTAGIKEVIAEMLVHMPVYRSYGNALPLPLQDKVVLAGVFDRVKQDKPELAESVSVLERILDNGLDNKKEEILAFYQRCMQYSCVLMAKGIEDTQMYTYNRFIAHNEVGDQPDMFGIDTATFHSLMADRQAKYPFTMNATSTHDTKRGEDTRARLNVLSEIPSEWMKTTDAWFKLIRNNDVAIDDNIMYFIFQTLVGSYQPEASIEEYKERLRNYIQKALREGKVHSDWEKPDSAYEESAYRLIDFMLDRNQAFLSSLKTFINRIIDYGYLNSLLQVILKMTCPGIPDVYQGCDLWDYSFADPDNRRSVDYSARMQMNNKGADVATLWKGRHNGKIKQYVTQVLLEERAANVDVFLSGDYVPLEVGGKYEGHILSFARVISDNWYIIIIPLFVSKLNVLQSVDLGDTNWEDTYVALPENAPANWYNIFDEEHLASEGRINIDIIFKKAQLSVLKSQL